MLSNLAISMVFLAIVVGYPVWKIVRRLGFSGWWALLFFVPLVNLASIWMLGLASWPVERKLEAQRNA